MKIKSAILILAVVPIFLSFNKSSVDKNQTVNPVLGDISYERKFGEKPGEATDNDLRIKTHLEYVEQLLRKTPVSHLSKELQIKRSHLLDLLHNYWTKGVFPKNYDYADQRKPCFIDRDGNICAVGYLVEQTTSRKVAEEINGKHQYNEVLEMNDEIVDNWVLNSGLTNQECAMIQPAYGPEPISAGYGISSSIIGGVNLSVNTINGIQIGKGTTHKTIPIIGLITGAGQIVLGAASYPRERGWNLGDNPGEAVKTVSMINIGLGTSTMILSAWNLLANRKPKKKLTTWNIYSFPTQGKKTGLAFSLARRF